MLDLALLKGIFMLTFGYEARNKTNRWYITFNLPSFQYFLLIFFVDIFVSRADSDAEAWRCRHGALYPQQTPVPWMFSGC